MSITDSFLNYLGFLMQHLPGIVFTLISVTLLYMYIRDKFQHEHTIRRNYPVIGRFRYWFEEMGVFFRQYFFALDREEMPFNRAERTWVYQSSKGHSNNQAFGSTHKPKEGDVIFANTIFPKTEDIKHINISFGDGNHCNNPYFAKRFFNVSGMSFGALSEPAIKALTEGARKSGAWINTGEGGPSQFHLESGADLVVQIGTAKYGFRDENGNFCHKKLKEVASLPQVKMFEIKLSQGSKPGLGGILPAGKVTPEIAKSRGIPVGQASISPNGHHEFSDAQGLFKFIKDIRELTGKPVGFKLCIGNVTEFDNLITELVKMTEADNFKNYYAPDFITIDSGDGGTGAAPMSHMDATGLNIRQSLPSAANIINQHDSLRGRVRLIASGKLITPVDVAWALCAGADAVVSARGFMFSMGCIQAMVCNKNTCPTGIATQDKNLQKGLDPKVKANRVANYVESMETEVNKIARTCGVNNGTNLTRNNALILVSNQEAQPMSKVYKHRNH